MHSVILVSAFNAFFLWYVSLGLKVCLLSDSMCHGVEDHINNIQAFVRPGTNLSLSLVQHTCHFDALKGPMLILINIGTNDVTSGVRPQKISSVFRMATMNICTLQCCHGLWMICTPRLWWRNVMFCWNVALWTVNNVVFLQTHPVLHLTFGGKQRLFGYINKFLWHFCRHK